MDEDRELIAESIDDRPQISRTKHSTKDAQQFEQFSNRLNRMLVEWSRRRDRHIIHLVILGIALSAIMAIAFIVLILK